MKIASGICRAESRNEVIFALDCGGGHVLVDIGGEAGLAAKLEQLQGDGVELEKIAALLITHCHEDHAGAASQLCQGRPVRVVAHRLAVERLRHCPAYTPVDPNLVDYTVEDGDTVEIGNLVFQVHHLPGHTPDSVAWQLGDSLFVGDIMRCDGTIGWMDVHWGSCVSDYRNSLQRLLRMKLTSIYPGHGACGPFKKDAVEAALHRLNVLAEADGSLLTAVGRPAPRRPPGTPAKIIRLSAGQLPH
jgi:glyoxylase-like metal-dependent hydrolase (beta-lactamase superfamily II)